MTIDELYDAATALDVPAHQWVRFLLDTLHTDAL